MSGYRLLKRYDGSVEIPYGIAAEFSDDVHDEIVSEDEFEAVLEEILDELEYDDDVIWIEPDVPLYEVLPELLGTPVQGQTLPWNIQRVGQATGDVSGVDVYLLDSGVDTGDLNVVETLDFVGGTLSPVGITHGYHIAGTLAALDNSDGVVGTAPGARIHSFRVLNNLGETHLSTVIDALNEIISRKNANPSQPMVINLSFGGNVGTLETNALDETVEAAVAAGIVVIVAAGNEGVDVATVTPARVASAITVGSFDNTDTFSSFSNHGSLVDLLAPGENILSSVGVDASGSVLLSTLSGTSMAAPHVTGAAVAFLQANPTATPEEVATALITTAESTISGVPAGTTNRAIQVQ